LFAANDFEQMSSEGGTASMMKKKASKPSDTNHSTGLFAANEFEQFQSEAGSAGPTNQAIDNSG
jgi:hypothetical protein